MAELEAIKVQTEVEEQNIALVKRHYEAWNIGDVDAIEGDYCQSRKEADTLWQRRSLFIWSK